MISVCNGLGRHCSLGVCVSVGWGSGALRQSSGRTVLADFSNGRLINGFDLSALLLVGGLRRAGAGSSLDSILVGLSRGIVGVGSQVPLGVLCGAFGEPVVD